MTITPLKLKFAPKWPGKVIGGPGISAVEANGNWTIGLDYPDLRTVSPYTPRATDYVLVYDQPNNQYFLVPATSFHL